MFHPAPCQHNLTSSGALAVSVCLLVRASTCYLCGRSSARAAPGTCRASVRPQQDEHCMLPYSWQFCNTFPASATTAWQGSRADECPRRGSPPLLVITGRVPSPTGPTRLARSPQGDDTPICLSTLSPYVTCTHPPTPCSAALVP